MSDIKQLHLVSTRLVSLVSLVTLAGCSRDFASRDEPDTNASQATVVGQAESKAELSSPGDFMQDSISERYYYESTRATVRGKRFAVSVDEDVAVTRAETTLPPPTDALRDDSRTGDLAANADRKISVSAMVDDVLPLLAYVDFHVGYATEDEFNRELDRWLYEHSGGVVDSEIGALITGLLFAVESPAEFDKKLAQSRIAGKYRGECMFEAGFKPESLVYEREAYLKLAASLGYSEPDALDLLRACDLRVTQLGSEIAADYFAANRHIYVMAAHEYLSQNASSVPSGVVFVE